MKREPSSPRLAKPSYRNRDPSLADQTHRVLFSLSGPFRFALRVEPRAEKTASSIRDVRYFETLINTDLSIFNRARGASEFSSPRSGLFAPISACKLFDAISALAIPCPVQTIVLVLCRNCETNSPFALVRAYSSRVSLSRSFVKRRCAVTDRIVLPSQRFPRVTISTKQAREEAVVRVAGSFGRDKQPRGLKGFRVMYARGGYLGLGTREEKTNERMDATGLRADSLDVFSLPFVFSRVPSASLFGRWKIRGEYAK